MTGGFVEERQFCDMPHSNLLYTKYLQTVQLPELAVRNFRFFHKVYSVHTDNTNTNNALSIYYFPLPLYSLSLTLLPTVVKKSEKNT